jgi:HAD domain in Swiss Army Knife RNA repair proteins
VDVDGVLSLFGFRDLPGPATLVDGVPHYIPAASGPRLTRLAERYELVWATGWEEKANEYLPHLLQLPFKELPFLSFDNRAVFGTAHWKLDAIEEHARGRPLAWIDDSLDDECRQWARSRSAPTLLIETDSLVGLTDAHVDQLLSWDP